MNTSKNLIFHHLRILCVNVSGFQKISIRRKRRPLTVVRVFVFQNVVVCCSSVVLTKHTIATKFFR